MTNEEKSILLKDLCARWPYKPTVHARWSYRETDGTIKYKEVDRKLEINDFYAIWDIRPYLRPMSSMTEEESKGFALLQTVFYIDGFLYPIAAINMVNWLNSHHFDYCGLIEKGLALEAKEGMYK